MEKKVIGTRPVFESNSINSEIPQVDFFKLSVDNKDNLIVSGQVKGYYFHWTEDYDTNINKIDYFVGKLNSKNGDKLYGFEQRVNHNLINKLVMNFYSDEDNNLYAIKSELNGLRIVKIDDSGNLKCETEIISDISTDFTVANKNIFVMSSDFKLYKFDSNCNKMFEILVVKNHEDTKNIDLKNSSLMNDKNNNILFCTNSKSTFFGQRKGGYDIGVIFFQVLMDQ